MSTTTKMTPKNAVAEREAVANVHTMSNSVATPGADQSRSSSTPPLSALACLLTAITLPFLVFSGNPFSLWLALAASVVVVYLAERLFCILVSKKSSRGSTIRSITAWAVRAAAGLGCFCVLAGLRYQHKYGLNLATAGQGVVRDVALSWVWTIVSAYDPCQPKTACLGPAEHEGSERSEYVRIEDIDFATLGNPDGRIVLEDFHNERIVYSHYPFAYQPYDEPRLHQLREKYGLEEITRNAKTDFEAMVSVRSWVRTQFRRRDYQPHMFRFDALTILDRNLRNPGDRPRSKGEEIDPCLLFPQLYCQALASLGYTGRFVNTDHGMAEVWSNLHRKWVLMDAELDLHYEKAGVPLSLIEIIDEIAINGLHNIRIVRGTQSSGDGNTTMVHLRVPELNLKILQDLFDVPIYVDMRNDWLTNAYFRGHPKRSELNHLVYLPVASSEPIAFSARLRPLTNARVDVYWTLNQTEILAKAVPGTQTLQLKFKTVTPNFAGFEATTDEGFTTTVPGSRFDWNVHAGQNSITVRAVNQFGVKGIASFAKILVE